MDKVRLLAQMEKNLQFLATDLTDKNIQNIQIMGKFNGATGNLNAHLVAYPHINWL